MPWQFRVVDGADQGRVFPLPGAGIFPIGSSRKHAEICLNDLYVVRVHAEVEIDGARVVVTALDSPGGTLVNGQKIRQQELHHGDVVRMGNSHLLLEDVAVAAEAPPPPQDDSPVYDVEVLPDEAEEQAPEFEVEVLPDDQDENTSAAGTPGADALVQLVTMTSPPAHPLPANRLKELVGHNLAHFQVEDVIRAGHTGMVFRARDLKRDLLVSLKVLAPDFPHSEKEMQQFVQVFKRVLPLRHPNLVSLLGVGKAGPFCWLASEFVECVSLPDVIERLSKVDKIDWHRSYRVAVQIARALELAHAHDAIHRNITARHILWRTSDKVAKLAELGLAEALDGTNVKTITLRDKVQADLVYMSPEQTEPGRYVDGVCDIYSLGVVVYALLTGRFPCIGATQSDTIRAIRDSKPARPSKLQPEIPKRLEDIVLKMLAKRQEERYPTSASLLADLQVVGEEEDAPV
jgi:protein kinase-like protein/type III secretion system (T3SS) inner membrane Yop/YscD-like protein